MFSKVMSIPGWAGNWIQAGSKSDARPFLQSLSNEFHRELKQLLKHLAQANEELPVTEALHLAIENVTDSRESLRRRIRSTSTIDAGTALAELDERIGRCKALLQADVLSNSNEAKEIVIWTLNRLFSSKQKVKQLFSVGTDPMESARPSDDESETPFPIAKPRHEDVPVPEIPRMTLSSSLLYQLHHSLFPAERMIVGAGKRDGQNISIQAVFDVTGEAGPGGVRANPELLGRALIAMAETDTYFALWIHSHPGTGPDMTHPSQIDLRQHADWLKDYSKNLASMIMVKDGFARFWGAALETGKITLTVDGRGIEQCSKAENVYRIQSGRG